MVFFFGSDCLAFSDAFDAPSNGVPPFSSPYFVVVAPFSPRFGAFTVIVAATDLPYSIPFFPQWR